MAKQNQKFSFRNIAYQEKDSTFTGVCLDLDIVEEGHTTLSEAILSISDAVRSHINAASKLNFPKELISRPAPKEYWKMLDLITKLKIPKNIPENFQFFTSPIRTSKYSYA